MGLCMSKSKVSEKTTLYVPYNNVYPYKTTKYDKRPGDVDEETIKHLENTYKKRYLQYMQGDFRLKQMQNKITTYICDALTNNSEPLKAAIRHIDFVFGKCLFDKDLNKNNQFKYTDEEKYNIYKDIRGMMLEKYGFSLGR